MEGQPKAAPLLRYLKEEGRRSRPSIFVFQCFIAGRDRDVEENEGVPVFLYTFAQNYRRTTAKRSWPTASDRNRCGVGRRPTDWKEAEAPSQRRPLQERFLSEENSKKSGLARLPAILDKKRKGGWRPPFYINNMESFFHLRWPSRHFSRGQGASSDFASLAAVFCGQIMPFPQRLS